MGSKVFIFEFKVNSKGALKQIKEKNYYQKYMANYSEIYTIGVEFDSEQRNIVEYKWKKLQ